MPSQHPSSPFLDNAITQAPTYAPERRRQSEDNPLIPAGYTYFAQFVVHDLHRGQNRKKTSSPSHAAKADLSVLYGEKRSIASGYEYNGAFRFAVNRLVRYFGERRICEYDLPRDADGRALVAPGREFAGNPVNDSNRMISQLHVAFMRLHNRLFDELVRSGESETRAFEKARAQLVTHYQLAIIQDLLPRLTGRPALLNPKDAYSTLQDHYHIPKKLLKWELGPLLPPEFSAGIMRVGHGMVRDSYTLNGLDETPVPLLDLSHGEDRVGRDLQGGRVLPVGGSVVWNRFFDSDRRTRPQSSQLMGARFGVSMFELREIGDGRSVIDLDQETAGKLAMPTGQEVARQLGIPERLIYGTPVDPWMYALKEAETVEGGRRLGPMAAAVATCVLCSVLRQRGSIFDGTDAWRKNLVAGMGKPEQPMRLSDLLAYARAPMADSDLELAETRAPSHRTQGKASLLDPKGHLEGGAED